MPNIAVVAKITIIVDFKSKLNLAAKLAKGTKLIQPSHKVFNKTKKFQKKTENHLVQILLYKNKKLVFHVNISAEYNF